MKKNKMMLKLLSGVLLISAVAVILGFFGTRYLLRLIDTHNHKQVEHRFTPKFGIIIKRIHERTDLPYADLVKIYNEDDEAPMRVELINPKDVTAETQEPTYNLDENNALIFKFNESRFKDGPPPGMPMPPPPGMRPPGPHGGPGGHREPTLSMVAIPLSLTFIIILFSLSISVLFVLYYLRSQARKAADVLRALKLGDLKARFQTDRMDEASELMHEFNLMAEEIEKLVVDLKDTDNMRRSLLQELAHDLRTPIASMKSLLESLQFQGEKMNALQRQENVKMALTEVDYFHHLVEDLLFLSGVHDLKFRAKFSRVNLVDIIQHEVQVANETSAIKIKFSSDDFYEIEGNNFLIQRLIKNAISNAVANAKNQVNISIEEHGDQLSLFIDDDGPGLSKEEIDGFGQKRATRKIHEEAVNSKISVGLGAVIMQKICDIHSAQMKISNIASHSSSRENHNHGASLKFTFANLGK